MIEAGESVAPETGSQDLSDQEIDALVNRSEKASNRDVPMEQPAPEAKQPDQELSFEFKHDGKTVKASREQMLKWAGAGRNYPQLVQKLNQEKATWDSQREQWEKDWGQYRNIDGWAKQNPQAWNHIQENYRQLVAGGMPPGQAQAQAQWQDPYAHKFTQLEQSLSQLGQSVNEWKKDKETQTVAKEDQELEQEIRSIREKHADLDWEMFDETGKSLETQVLEHADKIGTKSFRAAFRDLLHEQLVDREKTQAKQEVSKSIQKRTKLGVLGTQPTSQGTSSAPQDIRKTSYEDLAKDWRSVVPGYRAS